jgi:crotonobetainyl-CoA:carnitine CoA-transferase CaiB-like acyl-CoA transferase
LKMLDRYDVLVEQFRPGVLARLGLSIESLRERFPRLVIASLTGYGQDGPLAKRAGHDLNYLARAGILGLQGPVDGAPQPPAFQLADVSGGLWLVIAILAALRSRDATGQGAAIDVAMIDSVLPFAVAQLAPIAVGQTPARGGEALTGGIAPYAVYAAKDGRFVALGALEPKFWMSFCAGVGLESDMSAMIAGPHQAEWRAKLTAIFATKTRDEWAAFGAERDCCLEPVLEPHELRSDPQQRVRGQWLTQSTPWGESLQFKLPVGSPRTESAPAMGEHTSQILSEAGLSEDAIATLRATGAAR